MSQSRNFSKPSNPGPFSEIEGGTRVQVHAQPGAKRTEVMGIHGDALKIRVQAPPLDGRANDELIRFLADACGVARSRVELARGAASRSKSFVIRGLAPAFVSQALGV